MANHRIQRVGLTTAAFLATAMAWPAASLAASAAPASAAHPAAVHPAAGAAPVNLVVDPGAERAKPDTDGGQVKVPGWTIVKGSMFTAVKYGAEGGFPDKHSPGPKHRGKNFFAGGPSGNTSGASQLDSVTAYQHMIRAGNARFTLSAFLGGFSSQTDRATVTVTWETAAGKALGHTTVGPVTVKQRKDVTGLLFRAKSGKVPDAASIARVSLHMVRDDGEYVDGYADNLSLTIFRKK
jgi:hypothetical protein